MMTKIELEQEMVRTLAKMTGVPNRNIRIQYQQKGMPNFKQGQDYIYVALSYTNSEFEKPVTVTFDGENEIETYTKIKGIVFNLVFVGDNASDNALKVMTLMNNNDYTRTLRKNDVYFISAVDTPRRIPLLVNNEWFEHVYLDIRFYQKLLYNQNRNRIEQVEVKIRTADEVDLDFKIGN